VCSVLRHREDGILLCVWLSDFCVVCCSVIVTVWRGIALGVVVCLCLCFCWLVARIGVLLLLIFLLFLFLVCLNGVCGLAAETCAGTVQAVSVFLHLLRLFCSGFLFCDLCVSLFACFSWLLCCECVFCGMFFVF